MAKRAKGLAATERDLLAQLRQSAESFLRAPAEEDRPEVGAIAEAVKALPEGDRVWILLALAVGGVLRTLLPQVRGASAQAVVHRSEDPVFRVQAGIAADLAGLLARAQLAGEVPASLGDLVATVGTEITELRSLLEQGFAALGRPAPDIAAASAAPRSLSLPDAFRTGLGLIPSSRLYWALQQRIADGRHFAAGTAGWPRAQIHEGKGRDRLTASIELRPEVPEGLLTEPLMDAERERMFRYVRELDPLDADVLDAVCAHWLATDPQSPTDQTWITADVILEYRGIRPKTAGGYRSGHRDEDRRAVARRIEHLSAVWITVGQMVVYEEQTGPSGRVRRRRRELGLQGRALVTTSRFGQLQVGGGMDPYAWFVRPGEVFAPFLLSSVGRQIAYLSRRALQYDPYREAVEKALTRYLAYQWRVRAAHRDLTQAFSVSALLEGADLRVNPQRPIRAKERLERALNRLAADGVVAGWAYEHGGSDQALPARNWLLAWLQWTVSVTPPDAIAEKYSHGYDSKLLLPPAEAPR